MTNPNLTVCNLIKKNEQEKSTWNIKRSLCAPNNLNAEKKVLIIIISGFHGKSIYLTPAADDQFEYFNISSEIPQNGTNGGKSSSSLL